MDALFKKGLYGLAAIVGGLWLVKKGREHLKTHAAFWPMPEIDRHVRAEYGVSRDGGKRSHQGTDYYAPPGTKITAPEGGRAYFSDTKLGGLGLTLKGDSGWQYYFAHMSLRSVGNGQAVPQGGLLGFTGRTGNAAALPSTESHLHLQVRNEKGERVDPETVSWMERIA